MFAFGIFIIHPQDVDYHIPTCGLLRCSSQRHGNAKAAVCGTGKITDPTFSILYDINTRTNLSDWVWREMLFIITRMENVIKKMTLVLIVLFIGIGTQSCSSKGDEASRRAEYTQIVEKKSAVDAMNELYVASDGDVESLARMLQTSPSVINRIRLGETNPTQDFELNFKEVLVYYYLNDRSFSKLQSALDDEYGWYDSVLNFPSHHPVWFWSINIALILILAFAALIAIWPILIELLIFLIAWIAMLISSPDPMIDKYTDSVNPVMEQML